MSTAETVRLQAGDATATIALRGAEPVSWRVGGRDLLWHGDPAHWSYSAPLLFPVVGASRDGHVTVGGRAFPMAQHGFARTLPFDLVAADETTAHLRLVDGPETRSRYPFAFAFDVAVRLSADALTLDFAVTNNGEEAMPYGLGFHPAFVWPLAGANRDGHRIRFERAERPDVPEVAPGGLLARRFRPVPLDGAVLPLSPELFTEALVFLDASSRSFAFEAPTGEAVTMATESFPHLAVWSRPDAPFLSLEAWTAHADWEDASGDLATRNSTIALAPGATGRHAIRLGWRPVGTAGRDR